MAECFYYKNGKKINDIQDVIAEFFKDNYLLRNSAIFSAEEIQGSTIKALKKIPGAITYEKSNQWEVTKFITNPNENFFSLIGIDTKTDRLAPQYIEKNRIAEYVKTNLKKVENLSDNVNVSNVTFTQSKLDELRAQKEFGSISDNKLIILLGEIEDIISFEEKIKDFGISIHKIISLKMQGKDSYKNEINTFLKKPENVEYFGNSPTDIWYNKIDELTTHIIEKVKQTGVPLSEIFLMSDGNTPVDVRGGGGLKGKLDIVAIDKAGDAHIFELKISKTKYQDWDSAKLLTLDWQLALYRQLLGQHIPVNKTMLYVIPIWISSLGDPNGMHLQDIANRKTESKVGLNTGDKLSRWANKILPTKVFSDYNPDREQKMMDELGALIPGYVVQTGIEDYDVDKIVENAKKRYEKDKVWKKYNNFDDIEGLAKGYIEADTEEEFRAKIELYVAHVRTQINRNVSILKDAIISAIKTGTPIKTNAYSSDKDITTNHLLKEYLNDEWEVVDNIPEALAMGLIVLKNSVSGLVNIMSLSINQFYAESKLPGKNYGDLELLKSFLFLNTFKEELLTIPGARVGQIIVYNPIINQVYSRTSFAKFKEFEGRMHEATLGNSLKLTKKDVAGIEDIALYNLDVNLRRFTGSEREVDQVNEIFAKFKEVGILDMTVDTLLEIQKDFFAAFEDYRYKTLEGKLNFDDQKEVLLALLQVAIVSASQMELTGDFQYLSKLSLGFSDFKSLIAALYTENQAKYDKEGRRIQGIVQGLLWTTPDWVASKDLANINKIMSTTNLHIGEWMTKVAGELRGYTKEYYQAINFTAFNKNVVGGTQGKHENLWLHRNGKVADDFRTKNPYIDDSDNVLSDPERKYLQIMLLQINMWKLEIPEEQINKLDASRLESITSHPKIKEAIDNGTYFNMPLVRREEISRHKDLLESAPKLWGTKIASYSQEINDYIDARELQAGDLKIIEKQKMGFYEMYDVYGRQTPEYVAKGIEKHSVNYFEWNLDTIAFRVAFSKIRKKHFDKKLPVINAYIWWMKLLAGKENVTISNQLEYIKNQMSLSVFDEPIIDEEFKDFSTVTAVMKQISTAGMLAFKPASLLKEMTIGVFKGATLAATQIYGKDQFNITDLASAYKKLMTIDNKFSTEFNLIDELNHYYRFANMDVNTIAKKMQTDRHGILKGTGRYMYMCNTIPDYFNRLSLFLAKMIHDGSYEAHSLVDGKFIYDPTKDKRFEHYFKNRSKYFKNDKYQPAPNDAKFNEQRRRYLILQEQLNKEYIGESEFNEEDLVNKAYSGEERNSLKSFTDMAYGYYDKDAQSQSNNTWWGMAFLQFMQFWPGKMKMWFAQPGGESPMGAIVQDFVEETDPITGEKVKKLRYFKTIEKEDGTIDVEETDEDTGDPVLKWTGTPYEGLWYSLMGTVKDVLKLDFKHIKGEEERNRRALFALADAGLMFMLLAIMKAILDGIIEESGTEGLSGTLLNMSSAVNNKVLNEYNVYQSTLGAVNSEPVFLSWGKKMSGDVWDAISGDKEVMDVMTRNIGAAEVFKW